MQNVLGTPTVAPLKFVPCDKHTVADIRPMCDVLKNPRRFERETTRWSLPVGAPGHARSTATRVLRPYSPPLLFFALGRLSSGTKFTAHGERTARTVFIRTTNIYLHTTFERNKLIFQNDRHDGYDTKAVSRDERQE